jgi:hypothetical protein
MVDLYVGQSVVAWARDGRTEVFEDAAGFAPALERCLLQAKREWRWFERKSVRVWLSGASARPFIVAPVAGLRSAAEAQAIATAAAGSATGIAAPCAVQLEGLPTAFPTLATAVAQSVIDAIHTAMKAHGAMAVSLRPWWARALDARLGQRLGATLVAVDEPDGVTLLGASGSVPTVATTLVPRPDPKQTLTMVRRLCMGHDVPPDRVSVCVFAVEHFHESVNGVHWSALEEVTT